jgi:hypothetical protein
MKPSQHLLAVIAAVGLAVGGSFAGEAHAAPPANITDA